MFDPEVDLLVDMEMGMSPVLIPATPLQPLRVVPYDHGAEPFDALCGESPPPLPLLAGSPALSTPKAKQGDHRPLGEDTPPSVQPPKCRKPFKQADAGGPFVVLSEGTDVGQWRRLELKFNDLSERARYLAVVYKFRTWLAACEPEQSNTDLDTYLGICKNGIFPRG